ncbi:MAG TPA: DinB family protein, partial [Herpetosiphonaceae bacterium]
MNAPNARADLLARIRSEHTRLEAMLARLSDDQMIQPALDEGWSVKDLLAHITWWEQRMLQLLQAAARGEKAPALLQPGEDWDVAIDRLNAATLAASRDQSLSDVRDA